MSLYIVNPKIKQPVVRVLNPGFQYKKYAIFAFSTFTTCNYDSFFNVSDYKHGFSIINLILQCSKWLEDPLNYPETSSVVIGTTWEQITINKRPLSCAYIYVTLFA